MDLFIIFYDSWHLGHQPLIIPAFQPMNSFPWGAWLGRELGRSRCVVLLQFYRQQSLYWDYRRWATSAGWFQCLQRSTDSAPYHHDCKALQKNPLKGRGQSSYLTIGPCVIMGFMGIWCGVLGVGMKYSCFDILYLWFFVHFRFNVLRSVDYFFTLDFNWRYMQ